VTHHFVLHCLGSPALFTAAGEQVRFRTRKHFALLIRLALDAGKQFTRDYLADLFWADVPPKFANHSLAQGLSVIKAKIAREAVVIQRATVGLAPGWIDVDALHLTDGAVDIQGPFLDGFELPIARPFEEWKDQHRARLAPQMRDCLVRLMDAARRIGDFATVERHATKLQELDPLSEEGIRGVMEARAWASDRSSALKAFARYEAQLADELGAKPGPDLVRMADLLRDGRRAPRPAVAGYPPPRIDRRFEPETLIGREREFSVLYDAWIEARRKNPRIVVVTSDPGVGKTTLVNAFASTCQMDGGVVARAQAYDAERELPFAVLGELVKQLATQRAIGSADPEALSELTRISGEILKAFPGVPKPVEWSPELMPLRIADAFLKTVTAVAADTPLVLVVDDIHASDNASTAILHSVGRKLVDTRVLLVITGRRSELRLSGAPWAFASDTSISAMRALEIDVLSESAAQTLIESLTGDPARTVPPATRIMRASGGNPLAIELLTREWLEHGSESLLTDVEALNTQPVATIGIPRAIAAVFERQCSRLDWTTRATLGLSAILGRRLADWPLYGALDIAPAVAVDALTRLKEEGLLREVRGDLEFRNELIRAQAYYAVASAARLHLHKKIGDLLAARPWSGDAAALSLEIAWHYLRGAAGEQAVPFAQQGAEAFLAIGAPHEAEDVLNAILAVPQQPRVLRLTRMLLAKALLDQSKAETALPLIAELTNYPEATLREQAEVAMMRATAEFLLNTEPGEKYCEVANAALDCANETEDPHLISRALFECARAGSEQGVGRLIDIAESGVRELAKRADVDRIPVAAITRSFCRVIRMDWLECIEELRNTMHRADSTANASELALMHSALSLAFLNLCRLDECLEECVAAFELSKRVGDDARMSVLASNVCVIQVARGMYQDAIRWGEASIVLGEASNSSALQMTYTNLVDAYLLVGREADAMAQMDRAREWLVPKRRWKFQAAFLLVSAAFELIRGNTALALDIIEDMEAVARDRDDAVPIPGAYWKLRIFRSAHLGSKADTTEFVRASTELLRKKSPYHYLDVLAARSWLERRETGKNTPETMRELRMFDELGAIGKRALLTAQRFLTPLLEHDLQATQVSGLGGPSRA